MARLAVAAEAAAPLLPAALFTTLDEDNREQLHTVPLALDPPGSPTDAVTKLTADPGGIWDFTARPMAAPSSIPG
ncbi:MAG: hypothetical protein R2838_16785 [Caldilineaceae bacterium]